MKQLLTLLGGLAFLAGLGGCITLEDSNSKTAAQEDINILREDLTRVRGRLDTIALENQRMAAELKDVRAAAADNRDQAAIQERLDNLERQIQAVNAAREQDKKAIVEQLSAKLAEIMKVSSRPPPPPSHPTPAGAGEHIVKAGETLSSIAATYKVKLSVLMEANGITDANSLRVGQKLAIPK
jgi:LysM repeat protein